MSNITVDTTCKCGDDFFNYVNNTWMDKNNIPDENERWGTFSVLQEESINRVKKLIEDCSQSENKNYLKIYTLYNQLLDTTSRSKKSNFSKINMMIKSIDGCLDVNNLFILMLQYNLDFDLTLPFSISVHSDLKNANYNILHLNSSGLGLPDRDYYHLESKDNIRHEYKKFIKTYSALFNTMIDHNKLYELEELLANKTFTKVQKRDPELQYNPMNFKKFIKTYPKLHFINAIFTRANKTDKLLDDTNELINVKNLNYFGYLNTLIIDDLLEMWKNYFKFKVIVGFSYYLTQDIEKCYFDFYYNILSGTEKMKDSWKRSLEIIESYMGELIGLMYVDKFFQPKSKQTVLEMVCYIKKVLNDYLINNNWMEESTKEKAIAKLNSMNIKIGYPDKAEKNYDKLEISDKLSLMDNILNIRKFNNMYDLLYLCEPLNRDKWFMSAHMVNAYYSPYYNEIVFPAGILASPMFSLEQDMAFNFGGIGTIIGHEITHGFDDQGCKFDASGNLNNWWTINDINNYKKKTEIIKQQFNNYTIEGKAVNGELTLGENIADIGGLTISFKAYQMYLAKYPEQNIFIDGVSPEQRFFLNYANIWKSKSRKEATLQRLLTDPHSPPYFRVNGVVRNVDAFYKAFNINNMDKLYLAPNDRARLWC